ncbi:MAG: hypothetical protein IT336_03525 [Thermomicrobiales bacterium]|nr:hypothetical protein [Thermomicrobiales bacterium]
MDGSRFDELIRRLGTARSRRSALRLLAGSAAAGAASILGRGGAEAAAKRGLGDICRKHADCSSSLCGSRDASGRQRCQCRVEEDCPAPPACYEAVCQSGACGTVATVDFQTDPTNCGTCGAVCPSAVCENGVCVPLTTTTTTTTTTAAPTTGLPTTTTKAPTTTTVRPTRG